MSPRTQRGPLGAATSRGMNARLHPFLCPDAILPEFLNSLKLRLSLDKLTPVMASLANSAETFSVDDNVFDFKLFSN